MTNSKYSNIVTFLLLIICIGGLFYAKRTINHFNKNLKIVIPKQYSIVILGDSHAASGINPKYISNSINLAQNTEHPVYSYYILRNILDNNKHINTIILSYSYHSLLLFGGSEGAEMMRRYHNVVDKEFYNKFFKLEGYSYSHFARYLIDTYDLPIGLANDIYEYVNVLLHPRNIHKYPFIGGFEETTKSLIGNRQYLNGRIAWHFKNRRKERVVSQLETEYLQKIVSLSNTNKVSLILVATPLQKEYLQRVPGKYIDYASVTSSLT